MEIEYGEPTTDRETQERIEFVIARLEEADDFKDDLDWRTQVVPGLTLEELIGAVVAADGGSK